MMDNDNGSTVSGDTGFESPVELPSRYDLQLLIIPVAFVLSLVAMHVFSLTPRISLVAASIVGAVAVVDGLFVNPPKPGSR